MMLWLVSPTPSPSPFVVSCPSPSTAPEWFAGAGAFAAAFVAIYVAIYAQRNARRLAHTGFDNTRRMARAEFVLETLTNLARLVGKRFVAHPQSEWILEARGLVAGLEKDQLPRLRAFIKKPPFDWDDRPPVKDEAIQPLYDDILAELEVALDAAIREHGSG